MLAQLQFILTLSLLASIFALPSFAQAPANGPPETIALRVKQGTDLSFDLSPDARSIVFDLLGQLWVVPASGGPARPITDAVRDTAEDLDPSFSPDGRRVVFRGERNGRTGLWLLSLDSGGPRQLTQLSNPDGYDGNAAWSPDGQVIAFSRIVLPDTPGGRVRSAIMLLDVASGTVRELQIAGVPNRFVSDPVWVRGGKEIAFVTRLPMSERGGRVWLIDAAGGQASPLTAESVQVQFPSFTPDGRFMAYFAPDPEGRVQVWVQEITGRTIVGSPIKLTNHADVTPTRIRWISDQNALVYSADGRLWKVSVSRKQPSEIKFTAQLSITRTHHALPPAQFPEPGHQQSARGFMGLALSPDGRQI